MAYASKDLTVLAYANGFTLWHYTTTDLAADVDTTGYFNGAADLLRVGDMVLANCAVGGAVVGGVLIVSANSGGVVTLASLTPRKEPDASECPECGDDAMEEIQGDKRQCGTCCHVIDLAA